MIVRLSSFALASAMFVSIAACGSDDGGGQPSQSTSSGSSGSSSSSSTSSSSSSTETSSGATGSKAFGADCTASPECSEGKCVLFTDNSGQERGFCSRICTKAEQCPEEGFVCNLAPYTACVPGKN
jgi:hypothetical protein